MTLGIHTIGSIWLTGCALFVAFMSACGAHKSQDVDS
jgi:hypothetical protein